MADKVIQAKITCRAGVFETNSSSMHSLIMTKEAKIPFPQSADWSVNYADDGSFVVEVGHNDFGRSPLAFLADPIDKFLYLLAGKYSRYSDNVGGKEQFIAAMVAKLDGCTGFSFPIDRWDGETDYGYVDHQSIGIVWSYLDQNGIDPFDFVFDARYIIVIDGDEYCAWDEMKKSGLVNTDNIEFDLGDMRE